MMFDFGTRRSSKRSSASPPGEFMRPNTFWLRTMVKPGVPRGTITVLCCWWRGLSASWRPITSSSLQRSSMMPLIHHLRPLST